MKVLAQLITFLMIALSVSYLNTSIELPEVRGEAISFDLSVDLEDDMADTGAEDDANEIEFHETEYFLSNQNFIFSPEVGSYLFLDNFPTFMSSYMFSIYIPPLDHSIS